MNAVDTISISTCGGWSNRETWLAGLWLTNDDGSYVLQEALNSASEACEQAACLEQLLREQLDDEVDNASLWADLLSTAFNRVNWVEVIENNQ